VQAQHFASPPGGGQFSNPASTDHGSRERALPTTRHKAV
jgi:L-rhamnose mutarotase